MKIESRLGGKDIEAWQPVESPSAEGLSTGSRNMKSVKRLTMNPEP